jgi:hypothetical protein
LQGRRKGRIPLRENGYKVPWKKERMVPRHGAPAVSLFFYPFLRREIE